MLDSERTTHVDPDALNQDGGPVYCIYSDKYVQDPKQILFRALPEGGFKAYGPAVDRMAAYENTGLNPNEILAMKKELRNLQAMYANLQRTFHRQLS